MRHADESLGFINDDFPSQLSVPGVDDNVVLVHEDTRHYQLNGDEADEEWDRLLPSEVRLVRLGPNYRPFAVSMLHTLHCLDRLRQSLLTKPTSSVGRFHVEHCANYIRESILCAADMQLEPESDPFVPRVCRDWTAVYAEVLRNHDGFINANVSVPFK